MTFDEIYLLNVIELLKDVIPFFVSIGTFFITYQVMKRLTKCYDDKLFNGSISLFVTTCLYLSTIFFFDLKRFDYFLDIFKVILPYINIFGYLIISVFKECPILNLIIILTLVNSINLLFDCNNFVSFKYFIVYIKENIKDKFNLVIIYLSKLERKIFSYNLLINNFQNKNNIIKLNSIYLC